MPEKKPRIGVESAAVEVEEGPDDDEAEEPPVAVRAAELVSATAVDDVSGARRMRCIALPLFCEKMFLLYFELTVSEVSASLFGFLCLCPAVSTVTSGV